MSLSYSSSHGSFEDRWILYATLRDCVQHHLEEGVPSERFATLHGISLALGKEAIEVSAPKLRAELQQARAALFSRPLSDLAISARTQAVVSLHWPPPPENKTTLVTDWTGSPLVARDAKTLEDVFGRFLDSLLDLTRDPAEVVQVRDL